MRKFQSATEPYNREKVRHYLWRCYFIGISPTKYKYHADDGNVPSTLKYLKLVHEQVEETETRRERLKSALYLRLNKRKVF